MTQNENTLTTATLLRYALIAFPLASGVLALQVIVPTFYAEATGLSLTMIGALLFASRLFDMVSDPVVGILSDKTPLKFGRRKIWVMLGMPLLLLSLWFLFTPPEGATWVYLLVTSVMVYGFGTMVIVPYYAWAAEVAEAYHDRSRITGARVLCGLIGTLVALSVAAAYGTEDVDLSPVLISIFLLTLGASVIGLGAISGLRDAPHAPQSQASLLDALKLFKRRTPLRQLLTAYLMNGTANGIPATLLFLFTTHVLEDRSIAGPLLFLYFAVSALSVPFWVWISGRTSKVWAWRTSLLAASLVFVWTPFLGAGDTMIFVAITLLTGVAAGADLSMPVAMQGDLVDWDAAVRGEARPGVFFAIWGTMTKLGFALAVGITFPILSLVGFDAQSDSNSATSLMVLGLLYAGLPVVLKVCALMLMKGYPISRARHDLIRERLSNRGVALEVPAE